MISPLLTSPKSSEPTLPPLDFPDTVALFQALERPRIFSTQAFANSSTSKALMLFALLPPFHVEAPFNLLILSINVIEVMLRHPAYGICFTSALTFTASLSLFLGWLFCITIYNCFPVYWLLFFFKRRARDICLCVSPCFHPCVSSTVSETQ